MENFKSGTILHCLKVTMNNPKSMKKVLPLSLVALFPFIFLKLPNEEVSARVLARVLAPIFFALFALSCITEIYKRVKHKEENIKNS